MSLEHHVTLEGKEGVDAYKVGSKGPRSQAEEASINQKWEKLSTDSNNN